MLPRLPMGRGPRSYLARASARPGVLALVAAIALVLGACQAPAATPSPAPTSTPKPSPAIPTLVPTSTPSPPPAESPVAEATKALVVEFARAQAVLDRDWENFRKAYMEWRQKGAGNEETMTKSLNGMVSRFQQIRNEVNQLPRPSLVRAVAENLVQAAEKEEAALSALRAGWRPGDEAAFQKYEGERTAAAKLRREAANRLTDLVAAASSENLEAITQFAQVRKSIDQDWDALHQEYDSWRKARPASTDEKDEKKAKDAEAATSDTLRQFVTRMQGLLDRLYTPPRPTSIGKSVDLLVEAGEKDEAALRKLRDSWKPGDDSSFFTYEKERVTVNRLRRDSTLGIEEARGAGSSENKAILQQFSSAYDKVNKAWDEFHAFYDAWRNKGGDADRDAIAKQLSGLLGDFRSFSARIYTLPRPAPVRPLAELLIQAAGKEEEALRNLRDGWKPYDSRYYQDYEREWGNIDRLRREAAAGLTDLLIKHNIPRAEIKP